MRRVPPLMRNSLRKRIAFDELHHKCAPATGVLETVERRDVRMIQGGKQLRLPLEPCQPVCIRGKVLRQELQRHVAPQTRVVRTVDLTHATDADKRLDFVRTDTTAS